MIQYSTGMSFIAHTLNTELLSRLTVNENVLRFLKFSTITVIGLASIPYSVLFQYSKNTMLSLFYIFNNSLNSPILGLFLLSMFNPYANYVGAMTAFLLNLAINLWLVLGSLVFSQTRSQEFETSTCSNSTRSTQTINYYPKNEALFLLYSVAPIWYCLFSVLFCFILGSLFSFAYSFVRTGSFDIDHRFRHDRRKYMFFYRFRNYF